MEISIQPRGGACEYRAIFTGLYMFLNNEFLTVVSFSSPHGLLAVGKVDQLHPDLAIDPLGILRPPSKLNHQLPLVQLICHGSVIFLKIHCDSVLMLSIFCRGHALTKVSCLFLGQCIFFFCKNGRCWL